MSDDNRQAVISETDWLAIEKTLSRNAGELRKLNEFLKYDPQNPGKPWANRAIRLHQQAAKAYNQGQPSVKLTASAETATAAAWGVFVPKKPQKSKVDSQPVADKPPLDKPELSQTEAVEPKPELDSGSATQPKPAESDDTKSGSTKTLPYVIVCLLAWALLAGVSMLILYLVYGVTGITLVMTSLGVSALATVSAVFVAWIYVRVKKFKHDNSSTDHAA